MNGRSWIGRAFGALWRGFEILGRILKALIVVFFILFLIVGLTGRRIEVPESTALVVNLSGVLVDQLQGDPFDRALSELQDTSESETLVKHVLEALKLAKDDDRIKAVVLHLEGLQGGGLSKLQAIGRALDDVSAAGKPVIAMADGYAQAQYYLAVHADELYMHNFGVVLIEGFGYYRAYLGQALEKLQIDVNVFRVGEYKSFVEPYLRNDMSEDDKRASRRWLTGLWEVYQSDVVAARGLEPRALDQYSNSLAELLRQADGDSAVAAVNAGLVDDLMSHQEFRSYMIDRVGESVKRAGTFEAISYRAYLSAVNSTATLAEPKADKVAVLVASGTIVDGDASPGAIGSLTLARTLRRATEDDAVKAVVLQVDSPGGSMLASEVIFDQIEYLKATGKPFVVSMSSLAASGGYYISMLADKIWANATTLSGSIGVGALFPTFQRGLGELGINVDGIGTTKLSGQLSPFRELGEDARELLEISTEEAYWKFIGKVAASRDMDIETVDGIAQGRVWIGTDALELGLVDQIGGLNDAIESAAELAGLSDGQYSIEYMEQDLTFAERFILQLADVSIAAGRWLGVSFDRRSSGRLSELLQVLERRFAELSQWNDPRGIYYHCFCEVW